MSMNLFIFFVVMFTAATIYSGIVDGNTGLATTTLTSSLAVDDTTMAVHRTQGFSSSGVLVIDAETICYSGSTATSFTGLTRGCRDTAADPHAASSGGAENRVYSQGPGLINALVGFNVASNFSDGGVVGLVKGSIKSVGQLPQWIAAAAKMVMWDYAYLDGNYVYFKYLLLYPLSAGMVLSFLRLVFGR